MPKINRSRWIALHVLCVGMLMIVLDVTVVNVALPAIQDELKFSASGLAWVVSAYMIAFGGLLLLSGRLGDPIGRRDVFLIGLTVFTVASFLCGIAQTQTGAATLRLLDRNEGIGLREGADVPGAVLIAVTIVVAVTVLPPDPAG